MLILSCPTGKHGQHTIVPLFMIYRDADSIDITRIGCERNRLRFERKSFRRFFAPTELFHICCSEFITYLEVRKWQQLQKFITLAIVFVSGRREDGVDDIPAANDRVAVRYSWRRHHRAADPVEQLLATEKETRRHKLIQMRTKLIGNRFIIPARRLTDERNRTRTQTCSNSCNFPSRNMSFITSGSTNGSWSAWMSSSESSIFSTASMPASSSAQSFNVSEAIPPVIAVCEKQREKRADNTMKPSNAQTTKRIIFLLFSPPTRFRFDLLFLRVALPESVSPHNGSFVKPPEMLWTAPFNFLLALKRFSSSTVSLKCCFGIFSRSFSATRESRPHRTETIERGEEKKWEK